VEDNDTNYLFMQEILNGTQARLIWAKGGRTAVEMCKAANNIDMVLMDIRIPNFDGFEATQKIKEFRPDLPIIAQTAYADAESKNRSIEAGCSDFLEKPFIRDSFLEIISKHLDV